ncbi:condensin complex subunit 3 [Panulirus ornatus]|uniref:condensin complex subunit 3 n=1 Tax=Panulirus ornatus TaxID=150431 RepID=UPI003A8949A9
MTPLKQIFSDSQRTVVSHPILVKKMLKIYLKGDFDSFVEEFTRLLRKSLIHGDKQPAVERTLNFVAKFATTKKGEHEQKDELEGREEEEEEEADPFLVNLIQFLLNNHEACNRAVRFRVCQLINKILNHMGEEAVIDDDLYNNIYDTMLHRLQDKVPIVRVQAVLALARLQDPRNKECPVIKAYRYHLAMDPNPDVRRAVLTNTAITFQTLPDILERTRDVRDLVRRQAYHVISQKVHVKSLTIAQRVRLISEGLKDRSDMVRRCVEKTLIQSWLRMVNGSVLDLLTCLDVEASVTEAELALKTIFRDVPYSDLIDNFGIVKEERVVNLDELQPESALYWRCLAEHLQNEGAEDALEIILPELTHFCSYVHKYVMMELMDTGDEQEVAVRCMEREFVTNQLVSMTMLYDLADEVGRRSLDQLVRTLLVSDKVGESLVKGLVEVFAKLHSPVTRVNQLAEIISEVRDPVCKTVERPLTDEEKRKRKLQAARIRVKINQLREEVEECVRSLDLIRAQALKDELQALEVGEILDNEEESTTSEEVQEERKDRATLAKCLSIVCHMVECPDVTVMTPTLHSLHENLILLCLRSEDPSVRNQGVWALGLFCHLSKDLAHQHIILFMQISRIDVEQIQLTALRCVIDLLHLYGLEEFIDAAEDITDVRVSKEPSKEKAKEEDYDGEGGAIISALCEMMDVDSVDVRTLAAEGLCKLLLACRITSSKLLSHLIIMWYNPITEDDSLLRHMLGVFFPLYASYGGSNQESLCEAVLPTLQTFFKAPSRSPLADVDVDDVANFLVSVTSPSIIADGITDKVNTHDTLVFTLCTEILAFPESSWTKVLIRCLNHLHLTPTNFSTLRQVHVLVRKMIKRVRERVSLNALERFCSSIQNMLQNAPEPNLETEEEKPDTTLVVNESGNLTGLSAMNKSLENTVIKKKRMLYNNQTMSDPEVFSSEAESDAEGSPTKRLARSTSKDSIDFGSPQMTSTQDNNLDEVNINPSEKTSCTAPATVVIPSSDAELELREKASEVVFSRTCVVQDDDQSSYLINSLGSSPLLPSRQLGNSGNQETTLKSLDSVEVSSDAFESLENEDESSSSVSSWRRRSKQKLTTCNSSEDEPTLPPKVPRTHSMSTDRPRRARRVTRSLGVPPDSSLSSPSGKVSHHRVLETSDDSTSDSGHLTPITRITRSKSYTTPVEKTSASKSRTLTPTDRSNKKKSLNTPQLTKTVEDSSQSSDSAKISRRKTSQKQKTQVDAKGSDGSPQHSHSTQSTRTRSQVLTSSEDTTPVRRSARIETSSASTDSDKTPTTCQSVCSATNKDSIKRSSRSKK